LERRESFFQFKAVENVRKMFKQTLDSVVLGMTMYRRREQVQMMGIEQLSALLKMSVYDNMSVLGDAEVAILNAMRTHQGAKMQKACMEILNVMEWAGFLSQKLSWEKELSMFLKAMVSHEEDASLQKHECYVLFRVGFTLRLSLDNNKSCIDAVVTALASHSDNRGVVYAGFAALVPGCYTQEMKAQTAHLTTRQQAVQLATEHAGRQAQRTAPLAKEAEELQAFYTASAEEQRKAARLAKQEMQRQAVQHRRKEHAAGQISSLDISPETTEKLQVQAQRMQNENHKLRKQLANAFAEEQRRADKQRLQFEEKKLRGNEPRQILERHQRREKQRVRYKGQRIWSEVSQHLKRNELCDSSLEEEEVQAEQSGGTAFPAQINHHSRGHALASASGRG